MTDHSVAKADQHALIAWIADEVGGSNGRLGKKALQKIVHLIQEFGGVNAGYHFSFYTYGPFSRDLAGDLDVVSALDGVNVFYNIGDNFYSIEAGDEAESTIQRGIEFLNANQASIDRVVGKFGGRLAKDLELVSTVAYLHHHAPPETFDDDRELVSHVKALKPQYENSKIEEAIREVKVFLAEQ